MNKLLIFDPCGFVDFFSEEGFYSLGKEKSELLINTKENYSDLTEHLELPFKVFSKNRIIKMFQYIINLGTFSFRLKRGVYKSIIFQMSPIPIIDYIFFKFIKKKTKIIFILHNEKPFHGNCLFFQKFFYKNLIKIFDKVVIHTQSSKKFLYSFNLDKKKIVNLMLPIAKIDETKTNNKSITEKINLLFFGVIRPYKGLNFFLKNFDNLEKVVKSKFNITICGTMKNLNQSQKLKIKRICDKYENINLIDSYVTKEYKEILYLENNFIIATYENINGSYVLNDAINYLLPPIITNLESLKETFKNSFNCFMLENNNSFFMKSKLLEISKISDYEYQKIKNNLRKTKKSIMSQNEYWKQVYNL